MTVSAVASRDFDVNRFVSASVLPVLGFALLTAVGALVRIPLPFTPVPLTMQTLAVMMAGFVLSPRAAFASQAVYVIAGLAGLPFLAASTGTYGYLAGFVVAAPAVSVIAARFGRPVACLAGTAIIHAFGCVGLVLAGISFGLPMLIAGSLPFLPGDLLKAAVAARISARF